MQAGQRLFAALHVFNGTGDLEVIVESDVRAHVGSGGASSGGGYYRPGAPLEEMAREALRKAGTKLPMKVRVVARQ